MRCFYDDAYFLPLPEGHPFPMEKFRDASNLLQDDPRLTIHRPRPLTRADLERVHPAQYLDRVSFDDEPAGQTGLTRKERLRLGLPAHPRLLARSTLETAGTVSATLAALEVGWAANLAGGTHHAFPDRGTGYCVLNDVAVAIAFLRAEQRCPAQILVVDTDAHQGNANHAWFRGDSSVFTYSIHVGRNYPAKKEPGDRDVPLERWADGPTYLATLAETLPPVFAQTEPDLVFWITGADPHENDRFGQLRLTTEEMAARDRFVAALCRDYQAATVVVYGGGYNRTPGYTGFLHAQSVQIAAAAAAP